MKAVVCSLLLSLLAVVLTFQAATLQAAELPSEVRKALYEAGQAMEAKKISDAESILIRYRQDHADLPHHLVEFTLGNALAMQNKPKDALNRYKQAVELEPGHAPAWQNLGKTALDLNDHALAGKALTRAYELEGKKNHDLLFNGCLAYILGGKSKDALPGLEALTSGQAGKPKAPWLEALLKVYLDLGQEKKAAQTLEGMVTRDGDSADLWKLLAQLRARQNEYKKSLTAWEIYTGMREATTEELVLMGDLYAAVGVPVKAAQSYEQALTRKECSRLREKLINAHLAARNPAKAAQSARQAIERTPSAALWQALGRALFDQGQYLEAMAAFEQSALLNPKDGTAHLLRGHCALRLKKRDLALAALEQARQFPAHRDQATALLQVATNL